MEEGGTWKVFLVDDHPALRAGLTRCIESDPSFHVCGHASKAAEAAHLLRSRKADGAIVDVSLPCSNGLDLLKTPRAKHPRLPMIVFSMYDEDVYAARAVRAGASAYAMKNENPEVLLAALRTVRAGGIAISLRLYDVVTNEFANASGAGI